MEKQYAEMGGVILDRIAKTSATPSFAVHRKDRHLSDSANRSFTN
ncbi:hypothetical protein [Sphingobacterium griseoflavum]|nr:hypothetical protein [Sphingobacterium griseoflavum]